MYAVRGAEPVGAARLLDSGTDTAGQADQPVTKIKLLRDGERVGHNPEREPARRLHYVGECVKEVFVGLGQPDAISSTQGILSLTVTVTVTNAARVLA